MDKEQAKEEMKKIGMGAVEDTVIKVIIPYLEKLASDSETAIDDVLLAAIKPELLKMIDKLDGEEN